MAGSNRRRILARAESVMNIAILMRRCAALRCYCPWFWLAPAVAACQNNGATGMDRGGCEALFRLDRTGGAGAGDLQRGGRQPYLSRVGAGPRRTVPGLGENLPRDGRPGGAASHRIVQSLSREVRRIPSADPQAGCLRLHQAQAAVADAAART